MDILSIYPKIVLWIADIILSLHESNTWPEREASTVKRIRGRLQRSMTNEMLNTLMQISINGPTVKSKQKLFLRWYQERSPSNTSTAFRKSLIFQLLVPLK